MSEYQYYYFESLDKPLTVQQQKQLRTISSRAEIDSRRLVNEYHFGDFRGKPLELMKKYFDAHIYYAGWATRNLMLKVPAKCVDLKQARKYCTKNTFNIVENGVDLIFCFNIWIEDGDGWWNENDKAKQLIVLRDDILGGDYRCLYLAWIARKRDDNYCEEDDSVQPPIPAGLRNMNDSLKMFAEFMYLRNDDLKESAKLSEGDVPKPPSVNEFKKWIAELPEKVKNDTILSLLSEKEAAQMIRQVLLNRFLKDGRTKKHDTVIPPKKKMLNQSTPPRKTK